MRTNSRPWPTTRNPRSAMKKLKTFRTSEARASRPATIQSIRRGLRIETRDASQLTSSR